MTKQKILMKIIKSNKKKKSRLKNIDFKKNWKKLTFSGALALLLFSSISFAGYAYIEQQNLKAQAESWTRVATYSINNGETRGYMCKKSLNTPYGRVWEVRSLLVNNTKYDYAIMDVEIYRGTKLVNISKHYVKPNTWGQVKTTYASRDLNDRYSLVMGIGGKGGGGGSENSRSFSTIGTC